MCIQLGINVLILESNRCIRRCVQSLFILPLSSYFGNGIFTVLAFVGLGTCVDNGHLVLWPPLVFLPDCLGRDGGEGLEDVHCLQDLAQL